MSQRKSAYESVAWQDNQTMEQGKSQPDMCTHVVYTCGVHRAGTANVACLPTLL